MAQIPGMTQSVIEEDFLLPEISERCHENRTEIAIHDPAVLYRYNIVKTASLMHSKCQRSVLVFISK